MTYPTVSLVLAALASYVLATLLATSIASAGFPVPNSRRIGCIDGLRGYLALSVVIHHFIIWMQVTRLGGGWQPPSVNLYNQIGAGGVGLFFMTTGFVFYPRVLAGFRASDWPAIFVTRVCRIVPLVIVSVALISTIIALRTGHGLDRGFPRAAAMWITSWGQPPLLHYDDSGRMDAYVLWSLWYEWVFYLVVLPVCALARDVVRGPSWLIPMAVLLIAVVGQALDLPIPMLKFLPLFAIGMLAYECHSHDRIARVLRAPVTAAFAAAALAIGMVMFDTPYRHAMPCYGFFFACVACGNSFGGVLRRRAAVVLGECSYGIYLLHGTVLNVAFVDGADVLQHLSTPLLPLVLPIIVALLTVMTPITYLLIERPAIRAGARLAKRRLGRRARAAALEFDVAP